SGFVISGDGYIVTNFHVVDRIPDGKVILNDKSKFDYEVVRFDKDIDLALIKIDASGLTPFKLQKSGTPDVGGDVYAIGAPESAELSQSLTKGVVSGIRTTESGAKLIQTDASVNPGNSGGALVDPKGVVRGVVSSKLAGFGVEGVAFGIPAYEILDRLKLETAY
ncbi:MAG TPA: trypsin-like peptidase domain-containing protein, partial [Fibrobacteria bacterium]|nr:trypsin-like peptidase domain-containing protein [Fibrobacteria bacterium]